MRQRGIPENAFETTKTDAHYSRVDATRWAEGRRSCVGRYFRADHRSVGCTAADQSARRGLLLRRGAEQGQRERRGGWRCGGALDVLGEWGRTRTKEGVREGGRPAGRRSVFQAEGDEQDKLQIARPKQLRGRQRGREKRRRRFERIDDHGASLLPRRVAAIAAADALRRTYGNSASEAAAKRLIRGLSSSVFRRCRLGAQQGCLNG